MSWLPYKWLAAYLGNLPFCLHLTLHDKAILPPVRQEALGERGVPLHTLLHQHTQVVTITQVLECLCWVLDRELGDFRSTEDVLVEDRVELSYITSARSTEN